MLPDRGRSLERLHPDSTRSRLLAVEECHRGAGMSPRMHLGQEHGLCPRGSIGPAALELGCLVFMGRPGLKFFAEIDPVFPQWGPYEASEGIYSGHGQNTGGGQPLNSP
jgi:hypothetical protein